MSGQLHAMVVLLLGKKTLFQFSRRMGGPHSQSGCHGVQKNLSPYVIQIWFLIQIFLERLYLDKYPCHHGMARPQVADRGTASDKEGSCE